ncbi:MAG: hypothetical protein AB1540_00330 [Bdellovibrionota bacterium]
MKRLTQVVLVFCLLFATVLVSNKIRFHYDWKDAFCRTLLTPFLGTVWADRFSETGFAKAQLGMDEQNIEDIVGKPIRKSCDNEGCLWVYADQDPDNLPYDRRWISFNSKHRVIEIRHDFYID